MQRQKRRWLAALAAGALLPLAASCAGLRLAPLTAQPTGEYHVGKFVWRDLITHDVPAARRFYGALFGWTFDSAEGETPYTVISHRGRPIGGIAYSNRIVNGRHITQWVDLMSVDDVDRSTALLRRNGGTVYFGPSTIPDRGRLAVVADPQGALFAMVHASGGDPPDQDPSVGDWLWSELWSKDPAAALAFYKQLAGFQEQSVPGPSDPNRPYTVLTRDGKPRAGLVPHPFPDRPTSWLCYVRVDDVAVIVAKARSLGAKIPLEPRPDLRNGTVALIVDPTGAAFVVQKWPIR
jgi:hypothetical protein